MLEVSTEFRKGVFFVRLIGRVDKNEDYLEKMNQIIEKVGIQYTVLNISKLHDISLESINHIINYNKQILKKKKRLLICDENNQRNRLFQKEIPNIQNEIEAFSLI